MFLPAAEKWNQLDEIGKENGQVIFIHAVISLVGSLSSWSGTLVRMRRCDIHSACWQLANQQRLVANAASQEKTATASHVEKENFFLVAAANSTAISKTPASLPCDIATQMPMFLLLRSSKFHDSWFIIACCHVFFFLHSRFPHLLVHLGS